MVIVADGRLSTLTSGSIFSTADVGNSRCSTRSVSDL